MKGSWTTWDHPWEVTQMSGPMVPMILTVIITPLLGSRLGKCDTEDPECPVALPVPMLAMRTPGDSSSAPCPWRTVEMSITGSMESMSTAGIDMKETWVSPRTMPTFIIYCKNMTARGISATKARI